MSPARRFPPAAQALIDGDRRALARLITGAENDDPGAREVLRAIYPHTGHAWLIGLAGPLGVGKSSLINALLAHVRSLGKKVAVVAVDPSSPFSGGSVLGDRIRLDRPPDDPGIFIRSMATRGHAGGLARATREVARLLEAAGFGIVLVETVGSGQVDVEIRQVATTSVVVLVPHLGDEVQTLKAGLFEIADVFCVNKSDLPGADRARRDLAELASLGSVDPGWRVPVVATSTTIPSGIPELWQAIEAHEHYLDSSGKRLEGERRRLTQEILALAESRFVADLSRDPSLPRRVEPVLAHRIDPETAARRWWQERRKGRA
ncbi:MAG: methylmalonyl Co-A mutase-associated GTPase MeaB [Candidatus Thermoplasmatota archaeon]|jgi:LAO/AO transport system kinase|nr:methylmalonyl Co-A mutase-associated GTPase MeaB [Candidatus Thermoplasmatota archaeon]MCL5983918.1 methylmalonyl Co-A mutase-associated GTPase MeaB [Candidatus Thermoplasmatota archaeon]